MALPSILTEEHDILIVDDRLENIRFLATLLAEHHFNVRKAVNGEMALQAIHAMPPDLILLDINMPGLNGYDVCRRLKENPTTAQIPVIFLSAVDDVDGKVKAFREGGVDYITKPFQFEEILARIQTQLSLRNLRVELQLKNDQLQSALNDLKLAQASLVQKEKMVGLAQLAAGFCHEINNPINFISGNINPTERYLQDLLSVIRLYQQEYPTPTPLIQEMLSELDLDFLKSDLDKMLRSMRIGVERVQSIILALRVFSRLDESDVKPVDLHAGIESALLLLQHQLEPEDSAFHIQVEKQYCDLPPIICHSRELNQAFLNLLTNAVEAISACEPPSASTPQLAASSSDAHALVPGAAKPIDWVPTIWVVTECCREGDRTVARVHIRDNGHGIEPTVQAKMFDPFYTTKPVGQGKGLGLTQSYQTVVEKHQGQLTCSSTLGEGTTFTVELPIRPEPRAMLRQNRDDRC
ncbi:sensor histidine kinase [Leptolyngbya sp. AN02str]|uniref:sensor histidine kinase n=1 Tax=Leptolyngbya sp. AN02str TaxID=3423363 RepID=UPI003D311E96